MELDVDRAEQPREASWDEIVEIFARGIELAEADRAGFLDVACAGCAGLRSEVEAMFASAGDSRALRVETRLLDGFGLPPFEEGRNVGAYRLLSLLGRGGMGEVYLGQREGGEFEQRVAVKLLRAGLLLPEMAARFRAERQILARLVHPHIVPLLDGGVSDDGRPYLVMQHVEGVPITEHCEKRQLPPADRVRLLATVCRAVQHAHANLVVHRDIKPSNILVTADGEPRLLDFGIAKLLVADEGGSSDATEAQLVFMTPERAAPEQRRGEPISTATDVYSLGVLLVELLTGRLPRVAPADGPAGGGAAELLRGRTLRGDLERIAAKALDPDPARRYASAGQLGEDLERWLAGQPVLAQPDRWTYRSRKFMRRHLAATIAAAAAVSALLAFAVTATLQARRIAAERDRASAEEAKATQVVELLVSLFEETDPEHGSGDTLPVGEFLAQARQRVAKLRDQPDLQVRLERVLAQIYEARSHYDEATELYSHARDLQTARAGPDDPLALDLGSELAYIMAMSSDRKAAEKLMRELLVRQRRVLGPGHRQVSEMLQTLSVVIKGEEGERLAREALAIERARVPPQAKLLAGALSGVGAARIRAGDLPEAAALYRETAAIYRREYGEEHPATITALSNLATATTDPAEQEALYRRVLAASRRMYGPDSAQVGDRQSYLGLALGKSGKLEEAESMLRQAVATWTRVGGSEHERTATSEVYLARILDSRGKTAEALGAAEHAAAVARSPEVDDPWLLSISQCQRAKTLVRAGRASEAVPAAREAVDALGPDTSRVAVLADARLALGLSLTSAGAPAEALDALEGALELRLRSAKEDDPRIGEVRCARGRALAALRRAEALDELRRGVASFAGWPAAHPVDVAACRSALAAAESSALSAQVRSRG